MNTAFAKRLGATVALVALTIAASSALAQSAPPAYSIIDLGVLPGSATSAAWGLNDLGDVTGWSAPGFVFSGTSTGFVWHNGAMSSIGTLRGKANSRGYAINSLGRVVGTTDTGTTPSSLPVLFRNNSLLSFDTSSYDVQPFYINDAGVIVGYYMKGNSSGTPIPAIWTEDPRKAGSFRRLDLATFPGEVALSNGANQSLMVVGYTQGAGHGAFGAFWNNDPNHTVSLLNPVPGDLSSVAFGVNGPGYAVGVSWFGIFHSSPVVWSADSSHIPTALPLLPGDVQGSAAAINDSGEIIGESGTFIAMPMGNPNTPVVWVNGQIFALQAALDASGAGWQITQATAINNHGQIAGYGFHNGVTRAFLMTPIAQ